jgi:molybdopterin converting factor small subunit
MKVKVRLFGEFREAAGKEAVELELPQGPIVRPPCGNWLA